MGLWREGADAVAPPCTGRHRELSDHEDDLHSPGRAYRLSWGGAAHMFVVEQTMSAAAVSLLTSEQERR